MKLPLKRIALMFAMEEEASASVRRLSLAPVAPFGDPKLPFKYFLGSRAKTEILVSAAGRDPRYGVCNVGTDAAVLGAYVVAREYAPDLILNAGTAGAFRSHGSQIGDVYVSQSSFVYHDRRIPLPGYKEFGIGSYPCAELPFDPAALGLKSGRVSTGNALDFTEYDAAAMAASGAHCKEMEAAAIAWVASLYGIPMLALKAVTDLIDDDTPPQAQFVKNLDVAVSALTDRLLGVVGALS